ncbi:MAG: repeat-like domain [Actinomycetia bacterium]|nr:repeat-like domain [Actinomycetes bacterium]
MDLDDFLGALAAAAVVPPLVLDDAREATELRVRRYRARRRIVSGIALVVVLATVLGGIVAVTRPSTEESVFVGQGRPGLTALPSEVAFVDATHGFGLLSQCDVPLDADPVCDITIGASADGGRTWVAAGRISQIRYAGWRGYPFIDLAARGTHVWVYGNRTFSSADGGKTFGEEQPGGIVSAFVARNDGAWAAVRDCAPSVTCATKLASVSMSGGTWHVFAHSPAITYPYVQLVRPTAAVVYLLPRDGGGVAYRSVDSGRSWRTLQLPEPHSVVALAAFGSSRVWVMSADANAAATQGGRKQLARSEDGGFTWRTVAVDVGAFTIRGQLPVGGFPQDLVATARNRLWTPLDRGPLLGSLDGGGHWLDAHVDSPIVGLSFVDAQHGWATSGGAALYRTTDGVHWHLIAGRPVKVNVAPTATSSTVGRP